MDEYQQDPYHQNRQNYNQNKNSHGQPFIHSNQGQYGDSLGPAPARNQGSSYAPLTDAASLRENDAGQPHRVSAARTTSSAGRRRKATKIGAWKLLSSYMKDQNKRPAIFALFVCLMTYMFNQVDRYLIGILASDMQESQGWYVFFFFFFCLLKLYFLFSVLLFLIIDYQSDSV